LSVGGCEDLNVVTGIRAFGEIGPGILDDENWRERLVSQALREVRLISESDLGLERE
jgi:hypothetical protein